MTSPAYPDPPDACPARTPPARALLVGGGGAPDLGPLGIALLAEGVEVLTVGGIEEALGAANTGQVRLAVVAMRPGGPALLGSLRRQWPWLPVLMVADAPAVPEAVAVLQAGAAWYGAASPGPDFLRAVRAALAAGQASGAGRSRSIVGESEAIRRTLRASALVAPTRTTVLLLGETGTGKERLAQAIHEASERRHGPFVAVNSAALVETLLESELFGHERGAFSGAHARREGRFKMADGGTIFLDEIGEMPLNTQCKLLRVLQERRFERAGGNQTLTVDVRIIAATNRDLRAMVEERTFRADLFYRLHVMAIEVPPLRARREDIPLLVEHLVPRLALELGLAEPPITREALAALAAYDWPGNVRELENVLQRALVLAQGAPVTGFELPRAAASGPAAAGAVAAPAPVVPGASFREIERHVIMTTYEACGRSPLRTAEVLGLSPRTVHYRLREYRGGKGRRLPRRPQETTELHSTPTARI
jgi:DNA-binding NtrC family response regulator